MKFRTTKRELRKNYGKDIYYVHMGSPKRLLGEPQAYCTRVEGWACDVWVFDGICITEGYSPIGQGIDFELYRDYERKAKDILDNGQDYKKQEKQIAKLRDKFINIIKGGAEK